MKGNKIRTDFSINNVEILDNKVCYSGFLEVDLVTLKHCLYRGGWSSAIKREVVRRAPGVGVLLYDPDLDKVLMVEQFRVGCLDDRIGPWKLELVAGLIDKAETAQEVAEREVKEEAGTEINGLIPVCEYYNSPGSSSEKMSIYCARVDASIGEGIFGLDDEDEDIRTVIISREEADQRVHDGKINNAMTIIALQWLTINLKAIQKQLKELAGKQEIVEKN